MEEPSVLDYVIEKLTFWRKGSLVIPPAEQEPGMGLKDQTKSREDSPKGLWKNYLVSLPPLFAINAQIFGEPENRSSTLLIFFYAAAGIGLLLLIIFKKWELDPLVADEGEASEFTVRWIPFLVGSGLSVLAFFFFTGNLFNFINVFLWGAGFGLVWWSLRTPINWPGKIKTAWGKFIADGFKITPWMVLVAAVFLLAGFYRFYLLNQVPPEMFSDHAEKLIDVTDVLRGNHFIFFPRNTGREAFQMYLTAAVAKIFGTGISFLSLKLGTCLAGLLSLPFIYLLGKEIKSKEVGLLAMFFAGIAYWPNVISRVALRFALYPAFVAPTVYFLIRGIKRKKWNDFLFAGLFLGIGLHGYSPFRIVPFAVILILLIYFLHTRSKDNRRLAVIALLLVGLISLIVFLPLGRFASTNYSLFAYRMQTRMSDVETALPGSALGIFLSNLWKSLIMFQWDNGQIWVHSIPGRPALGGITAAMLTLGVVFLAIRYIKKRHWVDLSLLLLIPVLMLPSILSLAFPDENPSLNRSGGAIIPVFIIIAIAVENLVINLRSSIPGKAGKWISTGIVLFLSLISMQTNARLVFVDYYQQFKSRAWNTSEIGAVIEEFSETIGVADHAWVVPYPHWVDTRLVGIHAVGQVKDFALWHADIGSTEMADTPKLYIFKPEDEEAFQILQDLYPEGIIARYESEVEGRDFMLYYVLR
jgi:4-amino-4-deoxy-L-arabinose transferase-like glycosyltransferase